MVAAAVLAKNVAACPTSAKSPRRVDCWSGSPTGSRRMSGLPDLREKAPTGVTGGRNACGVPARSVAVIAVIAMIVVIAAGSGQVLDLVDDAARAVCQAVLLVLIDRLIAEGRSVQRGLDLARQGIAIGR